MSPSREGCTITFRLKGAVDTKKFGQRDDEGRVLGRERDTSLKQADGTNADQLSPSILSIVALRLLVGSTATECIPSYVSVMGRKKILSADCKRWYDIPLTKEEVVLSVRNGFVSLGFGPPVVAGNNALVDAIEVYAIERSKIEYFIPTQLTVSGTHEMEQQAKQTSANGNSVNSVVLQLRILSHLLELFNRDTRTPQISVLKQLLQKTALEEESAVRQSVIDLLQKVEPNRSLCQRIVDESTLLGLSRVLNSIEIDSPEHLEADPVSSSKDSVRSGGEESLESKWIKAKKTAQLVGNVLVAALNISHARPGSYLYGTKSLIEKRQCSRSVAVDAVNLLNSLLNQGFVHTDTVGKAVRLLLSEMSITMTMDSKVKRAYCNFDMLAKLLNSNDRKTTKSTCDSIFSFVDLHSENPSVSSPVAGYAHQSSDRSEESAPIAYQCDSCGAFPVSLF